MATKKHLLLVKNASQIVRVCSNKEERLTGSAMKDISILTAQSEGLSVAVDSQGDFISIGTNSEVASELSGMGGPGLQFERVIDAEGKSVIPGLVDAHTHPIWLGDRVHEFAMKVSLPNNSL